LCFNIGKDKIMKEISGGVCAAKGFKANGIHCGIRKNHSKRDLALIVSEKRAATACVYTANLVRSAPIKVTKSHVADGYAQAVICNSGNANTCNANGIEIAEGMSALVEQHTGIKAEDVIVGSTGVIGQPLSLEPIEGGMAELTAGLGDNSDAAADAIMTTDTRKKEIAVSFNIGETECKIGGIAKGSGMIHPNMATMLVFVTTDCAITPEMLQKALSEDVKTSFNMVSVDGDTSTNDTVAVMANGLAGNAEIATEGADFDAFCEALHYVTVALCRMIAGDGEGATKLVSCKVTGASDEATAKTVAKSVICSSLVKAAMFGADANWGRVLCAIGYGGANVDVDKVDVSFSSSAGEIPVCKDGAGIEFSEEKAKEILLEKEIDINVALNSGAATAEAWGCDLTYDYVKINGDYRT
jgi:glutamate N-acetyltransferase/amino-acid N-acetyltransferase